MNDLERCNLEIERVAPLVVSLQTQREGHKFDIPVNVARQQSEIREGVNITNYEMRLAGTATPAPDPKTIEVMCSFPAIREGDIPALVKAVNDAMAIDRQGNQHGIDDKTAVRKFCQLLDVENFEELVEELYPKKSYDRDRTKDLADEGTVPAPTPAAVPGAPPSIPPKVKEAQRIRIAIKRVEAALGRNGH